MELNDLLSSKCSGYQPMKAKQYDLSTVYGFGESVAKTVKMSPRLNLHELVQSNGGRVHYVDLAQFKQYHDNKQDVFKNSIYVHKEKDFDIVLRLYMPYVEKRFTIAHELGHYILHSEDKTVASIYGPDSVVEQEADLFALGFLMPREEFRMVYDEYKGNVCKIAIAFLVPEMAVKARIQSLNLKHSCA